VAAFGGAAVLGQRCPGGPAVRALAVAGLWVGQEALRGRTPFGGFPWGRLAFSQIDAPALGLAAIGGAPLVSFVAALAGALVAQALLVLRLRGRRDWLTAPPCAAAGSRARCGSAAGPRTPRAHPVAVRRAGRSASR